MASSSLPAPAATSLAVPIAAQLDQVPLIKSPSFRVQPPVELPPDIHPLPDDVSVYFVYPHTLEQHALSVLPTALTSLRQSQQHRISYLANRTAQKEAERKAKLNAIAPGWNGGGGGVMMPSLKVAGGGVKKEEEREELVAGKKEAQVKDETEEEKQARIEREQMDALVAGLEGGRLV